MSTDSSPAAFAVCAPGEKNLGVHFGDQTTTYKIGYDRTGGLSGIE
jgi:hypothetical protein